MQSSNTSLQYRYPNEHIRVKKQKQNKKQQQQKTKQICTLHFSVAIWLNHFAV